MITDEKLVDLGYEFLNKNSVGKIRLSYYKFEGRKYQVSLTDDGILGVMFPINYNPKVKTLVNVTEWETFLNWHNNYSE